MNRAILRSFAHGIFTLVGVFTVAFLILRGAWHVIKPLLAWVIAGCFCCAAFTMNAQALNFMAEEVNMTNAVLQYTPAPGNTNWFTVQPDGNTLVCSNMLVSFYWQDETRLSWNSRTNVGYVLQTSIDGTNWQAIPVVIMGSSGGKTEYYDHVQYGKSYRLTSFVPPPEHLKLEVTQQ